MVVPSAIERPTFNLEPPTFKKAGWCFVRLPPSQSTRPDDTSAGTAQRLRHSVGQVEDHDAHLGADYVAWLRNSCAIGERTLGARGRYVCIPYGRVGRRLLAGI